MASNIGIPGNTPQLYDIKTLKPNETWNVLPTNISHAVYSINFDKVYDYMRSQTSWISAFQDMRRLTDFSPVESWDTSMATMMNAMFYGCSGLTSLDLSGWDTSSVTDMRAMFYSCSNLNPIDVSGWDVSHVVNMSNMFANCSSLDKLDFTGWNTANVSDFQNFVKYDSALRKIWVPSTFVGSGVSATQQNSKPFHDAPNSSCHIYTNGSSALSMDWGNVDNSYTLHFNATYNDFLNA